MEKRKVNKLVVPKFANEQEEAKWWASADGRAFLKHQLAALSTDRRRGSKLVTKLVRADRPVPDA